jgi:hypothetical protein
VCDYPDSGVCELGGTRLDDGTGLIVRRSIVLDPAETLFAVWRHHAFVTDRAGTAADLDADHRQHAVVEPAIRDLKDGPLAWRDPHLATTGPVWIPPSPAVQRVTLWASIASAAHADFVAKFPDGQCANGPSLRSRMASSTTACPSRPATPPGRPPPTGRGAPRAPR